MLGEHPLRVGQQEVQDLLDLVTGFGHAGTGARDYSPRTASNSPVSTSRSTSRSISLGRQGRHLAGLHLALDLTLAEAAELQDLEHEHQVEARRKRDQAEARDHERPAGVESAVVLGVGHEAHRQRERRQRQRPPVQVEHGPPLGEADVGEAVVEVPSVGRVDGPAVLDPLGHHEGRVERRHGQDQQREEQRHDRRRLEDALDRHAREQQAEQVRPGVAHEDRGRVEVVPEEARPPLPP